MKIDAAVSNTGPGWGRNPALPAGLDLISGYSDSIWDEVNNFLSFLLIYWLNPTCPLNAKACLMHFALVAGLNNLNVMFVGFNWNANGSLEPRGDGWRRSWTDASVGENRLRAVTKATEAFKWNLGSLFYAAIWWITFSWVVTGPVKVCLWLASPNGSCLLGGINGRHTSRCLCLLSLLGRALPDVT